MKRNLLLFFFVFLCVNLAKAQTFAYNGINYNITDAANFKVEVGNNISFSGAANIPATAVYNSQNYDVTTIGNSAFISCSGLTSVTIPNTVTAINNNAFLRCSGLTSVTIPNSVTFIGQYAFTFCTGLTSITIPNSVTTMFSSVFGNCSSLTSATIPNSMTSIPNNTFFGCTSLTSVTIPNSVTSIGTDVFYDCSSLSSVSIPSSVASIGTKAFANCTSLRSLFVNRVQPPALPYDVFQGVNINSATLNVPIGSESSYEATPVWTEFNIVGGTPRGCWAELSIGGYHTLAIAQDGTLWAWGDNNFKQLGNNSAVAYQTTPVQISNERNWLFVSAGEHHSLAVKKDGTLWSWGRNNYGQLGNSTTTQQNTPMQIGTDTNWFSVSAGYHHSMAIKADNTLWAWGRNANGQIGNNTTSQQNTPVQVGTDTNWASVKLGRNHTIALKTDGKLYSWGQNSLGQLGQGDTTQRIIPTQVGTETTWKSIQAGEYHNLALKTGTLWSWGDNFAGQLGLGHITRQNSPVQVGTGTDWKFISAGANHSYASKSTGTLFSWGDNYFGQVGNGNFTQQNSPVQVGTATDWYAIFAGHYYGVSLKTNGNFLSWGDNQSGQLGNGNTTPNTTGQNTPGGMNCSGNVLAFDGVDDRVVIQNLGTGVLGDNSANESYTFTIKVKIPSVGATPLISKKTTTPSNQGFSIETDASGVVFFDQAYGGVFRRVQASTPLVANTWYTISATFDYPNKTHKLYLDGNEVATYTDTATPQFVGVTVRLTLGIPEGTLPSEVTTSFKANFAQALNIPLDRLQIQITTNRNNQTQLNVDPSKYLFKYQFNQGIADANNTGIITMQNEVFGSPYVGTLENFALIGSTSNWSYDVTAFETLNTNNFSLTDNIKIYPNPSTGIFTISLEVDADVIVHDLLGKVIYANKVKAGNNTIDISNYQSGMYLLQVETENGSVTKKLLKE
jgi:alpha-tubulin suppressor-like RCC1 family protein